MSILSRQMSESYYYLSRDDTTDLQSFSPMSKASDTTALMRLAGDFDNSDKTKIRNRIQTAQISSHSTPLARKQEDGDAYNKLDHLSRLSGTKNDPNNDLEARLKPLLRQELNGFKAEMEAMIRKQELKRQHTFKERMGALSTPICVENNEGGLAHHLLGELPGRKFDVSVPDSPVTTPPNSHEYTKESFGPSAFGPSDSFGYPNVTSPSPINPNPETPLNEEPHTNERDEAERLRIELARLQAENHQLQARNVDLTLHVNELEFELQNQQSVDITSSQIDMLELKHSMPTNIKPITIDLVPPEFRKHYKKLNLDVIDSISDIEVRNTLKNVMLSLLICDYQSLPEMSVKIANYIRITGEFMDEIHEKLYDIQGSLRPSSYLRAETPDAQARFLQCLHQMSDQIAGLTT